MEEKGLSLACGPTVLSGCLEHLPHPQLHKLSLGSEAAAG